MTLRKVWLTTHGAPGATPCTNPILKICEIDPPDGTTGLLLLVNFILTSGPHSKNASYPMLIPEIRRSDINANLQAVAKGRKLTDRYAVGQRTVL